MALFFIWSLGRCPIIWSLLLPMGLQIFLVNIYLCRSKQSVTDSIVLSLSGDKKYFRLSKRKDALFMYVYNERTKTIHTHECGFSKRIKYLGKYENFRKAIDDGYRFCEKCSPVTHAFHREKEWIKQYCIGKKLMYEFKDGMLVISSPYAIWRVVPSQEKGRMELWHQNTARHHQMRPFRFYHRQKFKSDDLQNFFEYITKHDIFREENPVGMKKPEFTDTMIKGTKRYKKTAKKIKEFEQIRARKNRIANVYFLLDKISAQHA